MLGVHLQHVLRTGTYGSQPLMSCLFIHLDVFFMLVEQFSLLC